MINELSKLDDFINKCKQPILDLAFRQSNKDFCQFADSDNKIKDEAIEIIIIEFIKLIKGEETR